MSTYQITEQELTRLLNIESAAKNFMAVLQDLGAPPTATMQLRCDDNITEGIVGGSIFELCIALGWLDAYPTRSQFMS